MMCKVTPSFLFGFSSRFLRSWTDVRPAGIHVRRSAQPALPCRRAFRPPFAVLENNLPKQEVSQVDKVQGIPWLLYRSGPGSQIVGKLQCLVFLVLPITVQVGLLTSLSQSCCCCCRCPACKA
eukprot:1139140-Pelagomonas_calceolata.AAC.7